MPIDRPSALTGTAGVYHVASRLAVLGYHAALTHGNAPAVDILVGDVRGRASLSLQVKTTHSAARTRGRGKTKTLHHYEWDVGRKSGNLNDPNLFFAFVDLKAGRSELPDVYLVPSKVIYEYFDTDFFKKTDRERRWRWHPRAETADRYCNNWSLLDEALNRH